MLFSIALSCVLLITCAFDLKSFRIPNALPLALIALFLIKVAAPTGMAPWPSHVTAFGLTLGLGFLAFALGLVGGGDAKLMSALALWFGMDALPSFIVMTAIGGGVLALVLLLLRWLFARRLIFSNMAGADAGPRLLERQAPVPYALPIALAAVLLEWS